MLIEGFTEALAGYRQGQEGSEAQVVALIYQDLRRLARRHLAGRRWGQTLGTTCLVNESYLRLVSPAARHVETRQHFLNLASRVMRQVICDYARRRLLSDQFMDRGADPEATLENSEVGEARQLIELDQALAELERVSQRQARVVECRFFAGLTAAETASALGVSERTVDRDWESARDWLARYVSVQE